MLPDFNRLKVFYYIYNEQSSTKAAKLLHITQSGVSQHLKKLEDEMRVSLFTRVNKRLVPTAAGHKLYGIVKNFVSDLEQGTGQLNEALERPSGTLRIGAPPEFGKIYMPEIFASFHRLYPDVSLYLELADPVKLFAMLSEGELDFSYIDILPILIDTPKGISAYTVEPIFKEEFVLACSKNYYDKNIRKCDLATLSDLSYIAYKKDLGLFHSWFRLHFETVPQSLDVVLTVDSAQAIIAAIEADLGLGITVSHFMAKQIAAGDIIPIQITGEKLENTISCVKFTNKELSMTESAFLEHFRVELKALHLNN